MVLVGGWPDSDTPQPYSAVSLRPCGLALPPLPRSSMWDPVAELVQDRMLICNMDYDKYIVSAMAKDYKCWSLDLAASPLTWTALPPPPMKLFLSTSASWEGLLAIIGGSQEHHHDLGQLDGTRQLQLYNPREGIWGLGPPLPASLFEGCAVPMGSHGLLVLGDFESGPTNLYLLSGPDGKWRQMPESRHLHVRPGCAATTLAGGLEGMVAISGDNAEFFSFLAEEWVDMPAPMVPRAQNMKVSVGLSEGKLVVAGGWDSSLQEMSQKVEAWEDASGWVAYPRDLSEGRTHQAELSLPASLCEAPKA